MEKSSIAIIIPSYNPTEQLNKLIDSLRLSVSNPIVVVNDGSDPAKYQHFFEKIKSHPDVTILEHEKNLGKGRALKTAFSHCLEQKYPAAVTADSDGQHLPEDIIKCIDILAENPDSLVLGVRDLQSKNFPFKNKFGNLLTRSVFQLLTGCFFSDTQTGLRGIPFALMEKLPDVPGERFEYETEMLREVRYSRFPHKEFPIATIYENKNQGSHFRPVIDSFLIYKTLIGNIVLQFIFFSCSGLFSYFVDIIAFSLFYYRIFDDNNGQLFYSVVSARCISAFLNYCLNRKFVFCNRSKSIEIKPLLKFILLFAIIMFASYGLTKGAIVLLPSFNETVLKVIVDLFLFWVSYSVQKFFIFKQSHQ
ncbi:MAG: bifunctional glycosyltransferase family 2/GtrA family protein [Lentisphaeria bacterium]|nr:bifunctional glycosyltransferase family 2/GtrA family protein [Lentisphaeria bacterium]